MATPTFVRGDACILQCVHKRPPLARGLCVGDHVVLQLQMGQVVVRCRHGVGVHLRQKIRVALVHAVVKDNAKVKQAARLPICEEFHSPRHKSGPGSSQLVEILLLYHIGRTHGVVLLSEVHVRVQTRRALAADFPPVELLVMVCKRNEKSLHFI